MEYTLIYEKRKTLSLKVASDLSVVVKAPKGLPRAEIDSFVSAHKLWIEKAKARQEKRTATENALTNERIAELRACAEETIPQRVAFYAKMMGVQPSGIKITSAKTRFGSCSGKNSLCFSWRLMLYPPEAVDYVVVHELAHIREKNHSPAFYAVVAAVLPDYKAREQLLKLK